MLYCGLYCFTVALLRLYCCFTAALLQVRCAGVGRFVSVLLPGPRRFLSLCEVQVWADESARMRVDQDAQAVVALADGYSITQVCSRMLTDADAC